MPFNVCASSAYLPCHKSGPPLSLSLVSFMRPTPTTFLSAILSSLGGPRHGAILQDGPEVARRSPSMLRLTRPICSPPGGVGGGRQRRRRGHRSIRDEFHKIRKTERRRRRRRRRRRQSEYFEGSFCQCPSRSAFWRRSNTDHDYAEQHNGEGPMFLQLSEVHTNECPPY